MVAVFLWVAMNDRNLLGENGVYSRLQNLVTGAVVLVCVILGLCGLTAAVQSAIDFL